MGDVTRQRGLKAYTWGIALLGTALLAYGGVRLPWDQLGPFLFFLGLGAGIQLIPVALSKNSNVSVAFAVTYASLLVFGPAGGSWVAAATGVTGGLYPRKLKLDRFLFNVGSLAVSAWIAGELMVVAGALAPALWPLRLAILYVLSPAVYFLANSTFVTVGIALSRGEGVYRIWNQNFRWMAPNYLGLAPIGVVFAKVHATVGMLGVAVFILPLLMARYSFKLYMDKTTEVEKHMVALREHAATIEATNKKLNQKIQELSALQQTATAIGSTLNLHETLNVIIDLSSQAIGFSLGFLMLCEDGQRVNLEVHRGLTGEGGGVPLNRRAACDIALEVARTQQPYLLEPMDKVIDLEAYRRRGGQEDALYFVPLVVKGSTVGVMGLTCRSDSIRDLEQVLNIFVAQAAVAIANAKLYQHTERMAVTDGLTGLYNHRHFKDLLRQEFALAEEKRTPLSMLILDVDNFKTINDTHGHPAGDHVLKEVARLIKQNIRETDVTARYGGDEFVVILPGCPGDRALQVAEMIRKSVAFHDFTFADKKIRPTLSVGIATYPEDVKTDQQLVDMADQAAYYSKQTGRNRVSLASALGFVEEGAHSVRSQTAGEPATAEGSDIYLETIRALSYLVNAKDPHTYGHSTRVEHFAVLLCQELGLEPGQVRIIQRAALLHDIGKVGISEAILQKHGPLTAVEYEIMKQHPTIGAQILERVDFLADVVPLVYYHQERYDGSGYPAGLKGDEIPFGARLIAVCDAFEAMTSHRPYRQAKAIPDALAELRRFSGRMFDPHLVEAFCRMMERRIVDQAVKDAAAGSAPRKLRAASRAVS